MDYLAASGLATKTLVEWSDNTVAGAQLGDIIAFDWNDGQDGSIDHLEFVTGFNASGYPTVSQHTPARKDEFWSWDPSGNDWIQTTHRSSSGIDPAAYLIHIVG